MVGQNTYGEESETVLQTLSLKHLEYEEALALLLGSDAMQQYLKKTPLSPSRWKQKTGTLRCSQAFRSAWTQP